MFNTNALSNFSKATVFRFRAIILKNTPSHVRLKHTEGLLAGLGPLRLMSHDIELNGLGQRTALPNSHNVTLFHGETGAAMGVNVLVTLLETTVLLDVVEVIPTNNDGALHLRGDDDSLQDLTTDRNVPSEGTLLVDVVSLDGGVGGLDAKTNVLDPSHGLNLLGADAALACDEDGILGLVRPFVLYRVPSPHDNGAQ
jgi:hypothetical protein